jgi:hypothetical protein
MIDQRMNDRVKTPSEDRKPEPDAQVRAEKTTQDLSLARASFGLYFRSVLHQAQQSQT